MTEKNYLGRGLRGLAAGAVLYASSFLTSCATKQITFDDPSIPSTFNISGNLSVEYDEQGRVSKVTRDETSRMFGESRMWTYERPVDGVVIETRVNLNLELEEDSVAPIKATRRLVFDDKGRVISWYNTEDWDGRGFPYKTTTGRSKFLEEEGIVVKFQRKTEGTSCGPEIKWIENLKENK